MPKTCRSSTWSACRPAGPRPPAGRAPPPWATDKSTCSTRNRSGLCCLGAAPNSAFGTMFADRWVIDEALPNYIGMYDGQLMNEEIRAFVEGCGLALGIGAVLTDFNSGSFTARIDRSKSINILQHSARVGEAVYGNVEMKDVLVALAGQVARKTVAAPKARGLGPPVGPPGDKITVEYLYPRWERMLREGDILIAQTATSSLRMPFPQLPHASTFHTQPQS